jgi:phospholipid/cholesterol/gamma-HCH transport system permease protein
VNAVTDAAHTGEMHMSRPNGETWVVRLSERWTVQSELPMAADLQQQLDTGPRTQRLLVDTRKVTSWDSGFVTLRRKLAELCTEREILLDRAGLPEGVRRLLDFAAAVPEQAGARPPPCERR